MVNVLGKFVIWFPNRVQGGKSAQQFLEWRPTLNWLERSCVSALAFRGKENLFMGSCSGAVAILKASSKISV